MEISDNAQNILAKLGDSKPQKAGNLLHAEIRLTEEMRIREISRANKTKKFKARMDTLRYGIKSTDETKEQQ